MIREQLIVHHLHLKSSHTTKGKGKQQDLDDLERELLGLDEDAEGDPDISMIPACYQVGSEGWWAIEEKTKTMMRCFVNKHINFLKTLEGGACNPSQYDLTTCISRSSFMKQDYHS